MKRGNPALTNKKHHAMQLMHVDINPGFICQTSVDDQSCHQRLSWKTLSVIKL